jgi:hypothetical protein
MGKVLVRRHPVVDQIDEKALDAIVEEAIERFRPLEDRDAEFVRRFGKWTRPDNSPSYPIERWAMTRIRWDPRGDGIIDAAAFVTAFPDTADRTIVGEVCRFVAEEYEGKFATDDTLRSFKINLLRRLDAVGY